MKFDTASFLFGATSALTIFGLVNLIVGLYMRRKHSQNFELFKAQFKDMDRYDGPVA